MQTQSLMTTQFDYVNALPQAITPFSSFLTMHAKGYPDEFDPLGWSEIRAEAPELNAAAKLRPFWGVLKAWLLRSPWRSCRATCRASFNIASGVQKSNYFGISTKSSSVLADSAVF